MHRFERIQWAQNAGALKAYEARQTDELRSFLFYTWCVCSTCGWNASVIGQLLATTGKQTPSGANIVPRKRCSTPWFWRKISFWHKACGPSWYTTEESRDEVLGPQFQVVNIRCTLNVARRHVVRALTAESEKAIGQSARSGVCWMILLPILWGVQVTRWTFS